MSAPISVYGSSFQNIIGFSPVTLNSSSSQPSNVTSCAFLDCANFKDSLSAGITVLKALFFLSKSCFKNCTAYECGSPLLTYDVSHVEDISCLFCTDETDDFISFFVRSQGSSMSGSNVSQSIAESSAFVQIQASAQFALSYSIAANNSGKYSIQFFESPECNLESILLIDEKITASSIYAIEIENLKNIVFGYSDTPIFSNNFPKNSIIEGCMSFGRSIGLDVTAGISQMEGEVPLTLTDRGTLMEGCNFRGTKLKNKSHRYSIIMYVIINISS